VSDEALVRFLPDQSQSDASVALAVFWPEPQYRAAIARWPGLAALLGSTWDECRARTQGYCLLVDGHGLRIMQVPGDAAGLGEHLAAAGVAQPSERDLAAYPDLRTVAPAAMTAWPPERNARCWCGSGVKYKRCCRPRA
jgi:hypothetical protein